MTVGAAREKQTCATASPSGHWTDGAPAYARLYDVVAAAVRTELGEASATRCFYMPAQWVAPRFTVGRRWNIKRAISPQAAIIGTGNFARGEDDAFVDATLAHLARPSPSAAPSTPAAWLWWDDEASDESSGEQDDRGDGGVWWSYSYGVAPITPDVLGMSYYGKASEGYTVRSFAEARSSGSSGSARQTVTLRTG